MKKNPILLAALSIIALVAGILAWRREMANLRARNWRRANGGRDVDDELTTSYSDHPTLEDIARLAQHYWEEEGCPEGHAQEHWKRAEMELRQHFSPGMPAS